MVNLQTGKYPKHIPGRIIISIGLHHEVRCNFIASDRELASLVCRPASSNGTFGARWPPAPARAGSFGMYALATAYHHLLTGILRIAVRRCSPSCARNPAGRGPPARGVACSFRLDHDRNILALGPGLRSSHGIDTASRSHRRLESGCHTGSRRTP